MAVHYNLQARRNLRSFIKKQNQSYDLQVIHEAARKLVDDYERNIEESLSARADFLLQISNKTASFYDEEIYNKKSFWGKILYFFGWLPPKERKLLSLTKNLEKRARTIEAEKVKWGFLDSLVLSLADDAIQSATDDEQNTDVLLKTLSHRSLLAVTDVPDSLQGTFRTNAYRQHILDLQDYLTTLPPNSPSRMRYEGILKQLLNCQEYEKRLWQYSARFKYLQSSGRFKDALIFQEEFLSEMVFNTVRAIDELEPGETALFSHGFTSLAGSHATLFEAERQDADDSAVLMFINTGYGVEKNYSWTTAFKSIFSSGKSPAKVTAPISIDELATAPLVPELLAPWIIPSPSLESGLQQMLKPLSDLQTRGILFDGKPQVRHQVMGSCAQSCIDAWQEMKCTETESISFQIFRLKKTLDQINTLLRRTDLNFHQAESCRRMQVAVYVELNSLQSRLSAISEKTRKSIDTCLRSLDKAREENAEAKDKKPKEIDLKDEKVLESYSQKKLSSSQAKFSRAEQDKINKVTLEDTISVITAPRSFFKMGKKRKLTEEEVKENKLNKVLLTKQITLFKAWDKHHQSLRQSAIKPGDLNQEQLKRVEELANLRKNDGSIQYSQLVM
ncbi:hypothetical protein Lbir_2176 [Legionella birminghamensis]|uniref:Uncharacterized protein n=1 Tax=Legionella birminghamensis TaxID=28083 RepID=A0A378I8Z1_9GAMM|nr:hypothetical protein [Legionella birminghamensis]KTC69437.1 hypothetical protein Lbir_2176 [Legionella birminghamensis]STX31678.1 Uncharacterised protein [Legionella birminghamensis]